MFYSISFAGNGDSKSEPLKCCWQLAHGHKLKKNTLLQFSIPDAAKLISKPTIALSLRTQAYLTTGLVIILKLKTGFLLSDVQAIRSKLEHWDALHKAHKSAHRSSSGKKKRRGRKVEDCKDALYRPQSKGTITLHEEDVPHLLEALQANNIERQSMMLQLAESDEFTLLGSLKFSSDARNASLSADGDADNLLDNMLHVNLPVDDDGMYMDDVDAMRYAVDDEEHGEGLGGDLIKRRRDRAQSDPGSSNPSGSLSNPSASGLYQRRGYGDSMNLDDDLAPLDGDLDLPMLTMPRPSGPDQAPSKRRPHSSAFTKSSSPEQSLSLNPASGSHSQASPDPCTAAALEDSDGNMHMCGMLNGGDNFELDNVDTRNLQGTPRNLPQPSASETTGNSSARQDEETDCPNVPSPDGQKVRRKIASGAAGAGCDRAGVRNKGRAAAARRGKPPTARKLRRDSELNTMCPEEYRAMVTQPSTFVPLPSLHCAVAASDAMPDVIDEDSFEAALRWRRMPLWEFLPVDTAAFIIARSCVEDPDHDQTFPETEDGEGRGAFHNGRRSKAAPNLLDYLKFPGDGARGGAGGGSGGVRAGAASEACVADYDEQMHWMSEDEFMHMQQNGELEGSEVQNNLEGSEMCLDGYGDMDEEERGKVLKRMRMAHVVAANEEDITMHGGEEGGAGVFGGDWSGRGTSDSGSLRASGSTGGRRNKGEPLARLDSKLLARAVSGDGDNNFATAAGWRQEWRQRQKAVSDASGSFLDDETPDVEQLRAAMHGSGSLAGGTFSSLQLARQRRRGVSTSDCTTLSKDSYDSRGAAPSGCASPPMMEMDITLPTLHEGDAEHDTSMHEDHAQKVHTGNKRTRPKEEADLAAGSRGEVPLHDADEMDLQAAENWGSEAGISGAGISGADIPDNGAPELPQDGSIPLMETQVGRTQTQPLDEHITQATADVYDALCQLHSEEGHIPADALSMHASVMGLNRPEAARVFYQLLVLQSHSMVHLKQPEPYADIMIQLLAE